MFIVPVLWLSTRPGFQLVHVWYISVMSMFLQAVVSMLLLRREFGRKLVPLFLQRLREDANQFVDVLRFDDERGRERDDVAGGADQQAALEALEIDAEGARAG